MESGGGSPTPRSDDEEFLFLPITSKETLDKCFNYYPQQHHKLLFIASYPKSGTTWLQCIAHQLLSHGDITFSHISDYSPFYESNKTWNNEEFIQLYRRNHERLGLEVFNTHLKWEMLPKGDNIKYIYIYRNGRDVVHSFYQHLSNQADSGTYEGSFDEFFHDWITCKIPYGKWTKHIKDWINVAKDPNSNILLLSYEELKNNFLDSLQRISDHIESGCSRQEIEEIIMPHCTFSFMKDHKSQYEPVSVGWKPGYEFIRKGIIGDSDDIFTEKFREEYQDMIRREFPDGLPDWIQDYW